MTKGRVADKPHKHNWKIRGWCLNPRDANVVCACGEVRDGVLFTTVEKKLVTQATHAEGSEIAAVHRVWHSFLRQFHPAHPSDGGTWKWTGFELMKRVERWAKRYPNDVRILSADDYFHSGSIIALVAHRSRYEWMGVSVVSIPQNSGPPCIMFLYPGEVDLAVKELRWAQAQAAKPERTSPGQRLRTCWQRKVEQRLNKELA